MESQPDKKINPPVNWDNYYENTLGSEKTKVSAIVEKGIHYVTNKGSAIELGAGSLRDTKFIVDSGFQNVVAYDNSPAVAKRLDSEYEGKIEVVMKDFNEFDYPQESFDFVFSRASLHFLKPDNFEKVLMKIVNSLRSQGIITLETLGPKDDWAFIKDRTYKSLDEIKDLFSDLEILFTKELEYDGPDARKTITKHWHKVFIVARKK